MPVIISANSMRKACSVSRAGVGAPQSIVEQAGWKQGQDKVEIGFIADASCILISKPSRSEGAFLVSFANKRTQTGARIACEAFARNYLQAVTVLPRRIAPVVFNDGMWRVALFLENLPWQTEEFSQKGVENMPGDATGVYQLLGRGGAVLRVGEGKIRERMNNHLGDHLRLMPSVKAFRCLSLKTKEDGELLEKILLAQYEAEAGVLPALNEIRS
jgi:hypothetical protein